MFALMILAALVMFVLYLAVAVILLIAAFVMALKGDKRSMSLSVLFAWIAGTVVLTMAPYVNQLFRYTTTPFLELPLFVVSLVWLLVCVGSAGAGFLAHRWMQRAPALT